jgi:cephalosporin-C deacetylase-like acetyl esterase
VPPVTRAELEAAADALIAYYLADRRTDDPLLREVLAVWAEWEEALEQARGRSFGGVLRSRRAARAAEAEAQARLESYLAAWRRWLDRLTEQGAPAS